GRGLGGPGGRDRPRAGDRHRRAGPRLRRRGRRAARGGRDDAHDARLPAARRDGRRRRAGAEQAGRAAGRGAGRVGPAVGPEPDRRGRAERPRRAAGRTVSARGRCATPGARTLDRQAAVGGPPWQVPVALLAAAAVAQVAGALALAAAAPDLAAGVAYGPAQLGAAHLLGLAFLTVAITGALLQLVPVLLRRPLGTPATWTAAGAGLACGSWALAVGLWADRPSAVAVGGTLVVAGGAVLLADLARALAGARRA